MQEVAALFGPIHGIVWLFGVFATWRDPRRTTGIAVCAAVPGIGGLLALRALDRADAQAPNPHAPADPAGSGRHAAPSATRGRS
ncbi:hypothetical protein NE235_01940 [Actinoallomurus spadix]|uniref:DUF3817 domain-containing protein n=1 Tax=Actinoallomurus spadix TaxID=79912 RepID=A0ABN0WQ33_9ACTN|nr:hypothetical protein [Actinoallomurus spadix]MCO5984863.1 hypothetical protein [Actinoallomurus spadix]